jgi:hypothetical protein
MISGFNHKVDEICPLLGYYAAYSGNYLTLFRDNLSVPFLRVKNMGWIVFPEMSVRNSYYTLCNIPEEWKSQLLTCSIGTQRGLFKLLLNTSNIDHLILICWGENNACTSLSGV